MLAKLSVNNFALIENAQLNLHNGFTVITGETGSGKSILLGALKLILGERADYSVIRDKARKTIVEAEFLIEDERYKAFFEENDLDWEPETIIRREISAKSGKSRAFINDTPVQLNILKSLTEKLIYIHSQHHTLELRDKHFQRSILDVLAENGKILKEFTILYNGINTLKREIAKLEENKATAELELDFNRFQFEELTKLELDRTDYEEIQNEVERGEQFEEIKNAFGLISSVINNEEGVLNMLNEIQKNISVKDAQIEELTKRIESVVIELKDIGDSAEVELSDMDMNPEELMMKTGKLDAFNSVLKKHNLNSQEELLQLMTELEDSIGEASNIDAVIEAKQNDLVKLELEANKVADKLSERRKKVARESEVQIAELLNELKIEDATVEFKVEDSELTPYGKDHVSLYFAPNKGIAAQTIEKSASGGELSRLMLALQFLLSQKQQLPTIIFDEIDSGVSGVVAQKIGVHLKKMGERMQLIAITHLPQVASKGAHHILVSKEEENETTKTYLKFLEEEERIIEIAKLMSGSNINEAALLNAKSLMYE